MDKTVYLSGPVENSDDPYSWREEVRREYGDEFETVDPLRDYPYEEYDNFDDFFSYMRVERKRKRFVTWCNNKARSVDGLFVGGWDEETLTVGTISEVKEAYEAHVPIVVNYSIKENNYPISTFMREWANYLSDDMHRCAKVLKRRMYDKRE